jgi:hypothetical protein
MSWRGALTALAAIAASLSVPRVCFAELEPVPLDWEAPKECPQEPAVLKELRNLVGRWTPENAVSFQARGSIEPFEGRYRLTLLIERGEARGTRVIESDDCKSLGKAAAIVLALLVQKERALGRDLADSEISGPSEQNRSSAEQDTSAAPLSSAGAGVPAAPPATPVPVPAPESVPTRQPPPPPEPAGVWHALLRAPEARVDFMTLPHVGFGVGLGGGVAYATWRALMRATVFTNQQVASASVPQYNVEYRRRSLDVLLCYGWRSGRVELSPCAAVAADLVSAHASSDYLVSQDKKGFWISVGGGVSGFLHLTPSVALAATFSGRFTTNRVDFLVGNVVAERAFQVPAGVIDASLATEWLF